MAKTDTESADAPEVALRLEEIEKWFRQGKRGAWLKVLTDISAEVYAGEFISIIGASGCGKTTLLRIIAGLIAPNQGRVTLEGEEVHGVPQGIGFVFQDPALLAWESVWRNVELGLSAQSMDNAERDRLVREQLGIIGLTDFVQAYPYQLSGGMQQRVGVARALIAKPRLLLLDEPLGALDAFTRVRLQEELSGLLAGTRCTSVLVTHDVEEALFLSDRVIVMGTSPGSIRSIVKVPGLRPRDRNTFLKDPEVVALRLQITESIVHKWNAPAAGA
jgi:ABC-type nitrate/sulfonate/bicarbonate transport system ATPase subunit